MKRVRQDLSVASCNCQDTAEDHGETEVERKNCNSKRKSVSVAAPSDQLFPLIVILDVNVTAATEAGTG